MTYSDTKEVLKRIKSNYQSFVCDDYVLKEWYKELKDYDIEDIMQKLEEHMRSEQYGNTFPKLYYLTKFLKKTEEKGIVNHYKLQCMHCKEFVDEELFDKHYERCLDIKYICDVRRKYFGTIISDEMKERFRQMNEDTFNTKYYEFVQNVYDNVPVEEQRRLDQIINPKIRHTESESLVDDEIDYLEKKMAISA